MAMTSKRPGEIIPRSEIPPLEILYETEAKPAILDMFREHKELAHYQMAIHLKRPYSTVQRACRDLVEDGKLKRRYVTIKLHGMSRCVAVYTLAKSSQGSQKAKGFS